MFKMWRCTMLPRHKWVRCEPVSSISDKLTCSCGQAFGMNNLEGIMLPWELVADFYQDRVVRRALSSAQEKS